MAELPQGPSPVVDPRIRRLERRLTIVSVAFIPTRLSVLGCTFTTSVPIGARSGPHHSLPPNSIFLGLRCPTKSAAASRPTRTGSRLRCGSRQAFSPAFATPGRHVNRFGLAWTKQVQSISPFTTAQATSVFASHFRPKGSHQLHSSRQMAPQFGLPGVFRGECWRLAPRCSGLACARR
jgi:hypothetical protein